MFRHILKNTGKPVLLYSKLTLTFERFIGYNLRKMTLCDRRVVL